MYLGRRWVDAERLYGRVLELKPDDTPARILWRRCREMRENPPPPDWDGIHRIESK
jgi:adenylate cyclase